MPRYYCFHCITNKWFEAFILLVIAMNVFTLALYDPLQEEDEGRNAVLAVFEYTFLAIYIIEALMRGIADGFFTAKNCTRIAYLQSSENILDVVIIVGGIIDIILGQLEISSSGITALRVLRVFRMLKFVKGFGQAKLVVQTLMASFGPLSKIVLIAFTIMIMYTALGLQLYAGKLNRACYWVDPFKQVEVRPCGFVPEAHQASQSHLHVSRAPYVLYVLNILTQYSPRALQCATGQICMQMKDLPPGSEPMQVLHNGTASFDNAAIAFYTVLATVTQEGWTDVLYVPWPHLARAHLPTINILNL